MKRIHLISKTHLDLGFTDHAGVIERRYTSLFFPDAVEVARDINDNCKRFVWTTGSWIVANALRDKNRLRRDALVAAVQRGDIAYHAAPLTTHSELMDADLAEYAFSIAARLDKEFGKKTIAAKMTDVPGHTIGLIPFFVRAGIRFLHIGVNEASAMPDIPDAFRWRDGRGNEIIVVYAKTYGEAYKHPQMEEMLYFLHTGDNHGAPSKEAVLETIASLRRQYPDYEVVASTLDAYAYAIEKIRDFLPVVTGEIGDTWIHGTQSDPYKSAAIRNLLTLKNTFLAEKSLVKYSPQYNNFMDNILLAVEHTWGVDNKIFLADYCHYSKAAFTRARARGRVHYCPIKSPDQFFKRLFKPKGDYREVEFAWKEQRDYLNKACNALPTDLKVRAKEVLAALKPQKGFDRTDMSKTEDLRLSARGIDIEFDAGGAIKQLTADDTLIFLNKNQGAALSYRCYSHKDYKNFFATYIRNLDKVSEWVYGDYDKPRLGAAHRHYKAGVFKYRAKAAYVAADGCKMLFELTCDPVACDLAGAPRVAELLYEIREDGKLAVSLIWLKKDASRIPEAVYFSLYPNADTADLRLKKIDSIISPDTIVSKGGKKNIAVWGTAFQCGGKRANIKNLDAGLLSIGNSDTLNFDDKLGDCREDGISFLLVNNIWETNFPLYYEDNALFRFEISIKDIKPTEVK